VLPEDIRDLAPEVLRHRMVLSYEALADDVTADTILSQTIDAVDTPRVALGDPYERERLRAATAGESPAGG
jgi:MoxR-like ATPase